MATGNPVTSHTGKCIARSTEETISVAAILLSEILNAGVVSLEGPLGAGKTHFVKGVAAAMRIDTAVTSPTFTLLHSYGFGNIRLHHSDWYRLNSAAEALALGLEEYQTDGPIIIEWGDKFPEILPSGTLHIRIEPLPDGARDISWHKG